MSIQTDLQRAAMCHSAFNLAVTEFVELLETQNWVAAEEARVRALTHVESHLDLLASAHRAHAILNGRH